jgi:MFS family permease
VLQAENAEDAEANRRSPLHWVVSATVLTLLLWATLATIAVPVGARLVAHVYGVEAETRIVDLEGAVRTRALFLAAAPTVAAFAAAGLSSGAALGRFAGRVGARHALIAGLLPGAFGTALAAFTGSLALPALGSAFLLLSATGAASTFLGWRLGQRRRGNLGS